MNKKPPVSRFSRRQPKPGTLHREWHNGGDLEIAFYTRSLRRAAHVLVGKFEEDPAAQKDWDVGPILLIYRQALELQMKSLVGEGSNFLKSPTDAITLYKTRSLRWLAQIVCQIIKAVGWENEFKCEGIASRAGFSALIDELEALDPITLAVRPAATRSTLSIVGPYQIVTIVQFARKLDAVLDLLDATADALAATCGLEGELTSPEFQADHLILKPTIH